MADATIAASIAAGIGEIITLCGTADNITFNGNLYTAARGVLSMEQQYSVVGTVDGYEESFTILQSALTANGDTPAEGDEITTTNGIKRILRITRDDSFGTTQRLHVGGRYS
jgi:hypothetical protein